MTGYGQQQPLTIDLLSANRVVSEAHSLPNLIKQLGLVIHVEFALEDVAFPAVNFKIDKGLADDKERYTTSIWMLCDSNVA